MGWDLSLKTKPCTHCGRADDGGSWSYTYNTSPMLRAAGLVVQDLVGQTGAVCAERIAAALTVLRADPARFQAMNPSNGWGSYDGVCKVLDEVRAACAAHPDAVMDGSF